MARAQVVILRAKEARIQVELIVFLIGIDLFEFRLVGE